MVSIGIVQAFARPLHDHHHHVEGGGRRIPREKAVISSLASTLALLVSTTVLPSLPFSSPSSAASPAHQVDYSTFQKKLFQRPPGRIQYPDWMEGEWDAEWKFIGADFPSSVASSKSAFIAKDKIIADTSLPGFRRLSVAITPDVGKPKVHHKMRFKAVEDEGARRIEEDRAYNIEQALEAELGKGAVTNIDYEPNKNPNRASLTLFPGVSPNARRIELFWNSRSILPAAPTDSKEVQAQSFRVAEDIRQVMLTPQLAETSIIGDYRHVWELYQDKVSTRREVLWEWSYRVNALTCFSPSLLNKTGTWRSQGVPEHDCLCHTSGPSLSIWCFPTFGRVLPHNLSYS